ncbi:MAG: type IV secretion system DNA-binding domain-containing protein [Candidatus Magasanikbacteria bacterium]|jgi:hypothetical protein|nr:type IV secretion system DNA-binding domain-containing protein [Candidatus Magasanikbacteria bacterium]MBT5262394.1 type IV secretion system DNA-binding domain-containing protein [Candidatus Magasanikbacteria bacterium]MBT5820573.1 type IV secretion system DNA-binding domain-containing protein [Candidatus Magasanikbacteria bacterium]
MPSHHFNGSGTAEDAISDLCLFGSINFRGKVKKFGIKTDDRRRHMYIVGKTGMGKSTLMENMVLQDIYNGQGVGVVDPHGDFAEKIINFIPEERIDDVVYFNPADKAYPIGLNILEVLNEDQRHLVVGGLMATFKKIWPDVWSARMEYILANTLSSLVEVPGTSLMGINRMYADKNYRKSIISQMKDPMVKRFWFDEYDKWEPRYQKEAVAPVQNKVGQFLSTSVIRNMVAQEKSGFDIRQAMDNKKILIVNLSKGRLGEDNSSLLGGMLITKIQLAAMERVDQPESERKDFFLYVDEFQNFATPSFANILSEARKYRLGLIMAHQYIAQLDEVVADAVFGNVGTIVSFRVGSADAEVLAKEFTPQFIEEDIVNLGKFSIILKLMIDGVASAPFSSGTLPPIGSPTGSEEKVISGSREKYAVDREVIEEVVQQWSEDIGEASKKNPPSDTKRKFSKKPQNRPQSYTHTPSRAPAITQTIQDRVNMIKRGDAVPSVLPKTQKHVQQASGPPLKKEGDLSFTGLFKKEEKGGIAHAKRPLPAQKHTKNGFQKPGRSVSGVDSIKKSDQNTLPPAGGKSSGSLPSRTDMSDKKRNNRPRRRHSRGPHQAGGQSSPKM